jgi:hypothetical protein
MTDSRNDALEKIEDLIRDWSSRIADLKSQADQAPAEKKIGMLNQIADLTHRKEKLLALADSLRQADEDSWERVKTEAAESFAGLDEAYRRALGYFH